MKIVFPQGRADSTGGTRTRTLTQAFRALTPTGSDLTDAGFLTVLCGVALTGFARSFDTWQFLFVGLLGVVFGVAAAHLARVMRWHWITVVLLVLVEFFVLGAALSLRDEALFGVLPTPQTALLLGRLTVGGWKEFLTTLPPVDGGGPFVALPYLLGLVAGSIGFLVARGTPRRPFWALATPLVLLVAVVLLGTLQPPSAAATGLAFAAVAFLWASVRQRQRRRLAGTGSTNRTQLLVGTAMVAVALAVGLGVGTVVPASGVQRFVLRSHVQPPIDLDQYASPLVAFRQYSSKSLARFHDTPLLQVEGADAGALLRFGVMDAYSGHDWSATGGGGAPGSGFQRLGSEIPNSSPDGKRTLTISVLQGYADDAGVLALWVPSLGDTASVEFAGPNAKGHEAAFRFNLSSMQGVVVDRLRRGDVLTVVTAPFPTEPGPDTDPGASAISSADRVAFLGPAAQRWSGTSASPWERLTAVAVVLRGGAWSDGTLQGEGQYLPGHGQRRLGDFVTLPQLVGSDEQYAATFAAVATQIGYPARVVMGAVVPEGGEVTGQDVQAWVEVQTASGWVAFPPTAFIPPRTERPTEQPQPMSENAAATHVPPPNPARAPGSFDELADGQLSAARLEGGWLASLLTVLLGILAVVGPPLAVVAALVGGILGAKALRSRRRRTRGVPAQRVTAGWRDVLDQARDLGIVVPTGATRVEEARRIGSPASIALAHRANALVLGPETPDADRAAGFWQDATATRRSLLQAVPRGRRVLARLNVRSLLPEKLAATPLPVVRVRRQASWLPRLRGR